jgi:3-oxoacyl-[acyl-carrier protein] reductase
MTDCIHPPHGPCFADLRGKAVLVTGGGAGLGRGISLRLAEEGMHVYLCGRTLSKLEAVADRIRAAGGTATPLVADVGVEADVAAMFARIAAERGALEVLVHNAALNTPSSLARTDTARYREIMATNIDSAYFLTRAYAELMIPRGTGNLIFISTIGAQQAHYKMLIYDTSKGALEAFTRGTALELSAHGIRVNAIAPGAILGRDMSAHPDAPWAVKNLAAHEDAVPLEMLAQPNIPLGRAGTPAELAAVVAFLASAQSSYITGQVLTVDGGATAQLTPRGAWI